jgi:hypothetical protein
MLMWVIVIGSRLMLLVDRSWGVCIGTMDLGQGYSWGEGREVLGFHSNVTVIWYNTWIYIQNLLLKQTPKQNAKGSFSVIRR